MHKLCCLFPSPDELPSVDFEVTCPSTCCVTVNKVLSRRSFRYERRNTTERVLQPETSSGVRVIGKTGKGHGAEHCESKSMVEKAADVHTTSSGAENVSHTTVHCT